MKLASLKSGRDGRLVVVSNDLHWYADAAHIAPTLQAALDAWETAEPMLRLLAQDLEHGAIPRERFHEREAAAPLPRAFQWVDGSAYVNHVELVRKARGAEMPPSFLHDPLMYQGGSDRFLAPTDPIPAATEDWGIDFEGEVAVAVDDVPMGVTAAAAQAHIKLVLLVNDVSLRNLIPNELAKGFGFFHGKPPTAFGPVAVDPAELGPAWDGGKLHLPLIATLNGRQVGCPDAGADMQFDFPALIAHAARTRPLAAGTLIGSGTISNRDRSKGWTCIAEVRMIETIDEGKPRTPFMRFGDTIRLEMPDAGGQSVFGAIEQTVVRAGPAS